MAESQIFFLAYTTICGTVMHMWNMFIALLWLPQSANFCDIESFLFLFGETT